MAARPSTPGSVVSTSTTTALAGHTAGGMEIDPHRDKDGSGLTSVSCTGASYCVASDESGFVYTFANGEWSRGIRVPGGTARLNAVSCATTSFCAAVAASSTDEAGWYTYDFSGGSWRSTTPTPTVDAGPGFSAVSCPTATFCAAVPGPGFATFSDGSWSSGPEPPLTPAPSSLDLTAVSCPSTFFCVAVGIDRGDGIWAVTFKEGTWSSLEQLGAGPNAMTSLSCATPTACVAVSGRGAFTYDGATWTSRPFPGGADVMSGVSCPTPSFCLAVGGGSVYTYTSGTWSSGRHLGADLTGVSCPTTSFCVAVGGGSAYTYSDGKWS
jgi:hypothetical protein